MLEFANDKSKEFYDYWLSMPREGLVPERNSFRPENVPSLLPNFMIYELVSSDYIKIRLLGSALSEKFGADSAGAGENYLDFVEPHRKAIASEALWSVVNKPCGIRVVVEQVLKSGLTVRMESIGLPLLNEGDGNPVILFQKNELDCERRVPDVDKDPIRYLKLLRREFIDIGAGLSQIGHLVYDGEVAV